MNATRILRLVLSLAALAFAAIGLEFWVAPEQAAHHFGIEAVRLAGVSALRADLGGLFVGLALVCGAAAFTKGRRFLAAAALFLVAIVLGRSIGWIVDGRSAAGLPELAIELVVLAAVVGYARATRASDGTVTPALSAQSRRGLRLRWLFGALAAAAAAGVAALLLPGVQQWLFDRGAEKLTATTNTAPLEDDALRVAICGSSAPLPSADRAKACAAVFAGGKFYVVDTGPESVENLVLWGIPLSQIGGVLFTHFHSDHIGDLGELQLQTWAGGRPAPLPVYGGPGVERLVNGFNEAYALDQGYRTTHHGERVMPSKTWGLVAKTVELDGPPTPAKDRSGLVLEEGGLRITAIEVDHAPIAPAYAYRFDYQGRSLVITGDLKYHPPLARAAKGADLLVSEAIATSMTKSLGRAARTAGKDKTAAIMHDIEDYHITPEQAAQTANDAGVKLLAFYHLLPAPDGFLTRRLFANGVNAARRGDWDIAEDGSLYTLPIGSREIEIGRIGG
jgi:ribonuclease Z